MPNEVYVLAKNGVEYARCPKIAQMRSAIFSEIRLGRMTEENFDEWRTWIEEFSDGIHLSGRRDPTSVELKQMGPWTE